VGAKRATSEEALWRSGDCLRLTVLARHVPQRTGGPALTICKRGRRHPIGSPEQVGATSAGPGIAQSTEVGDGVLSKLQTDRNIASLQDLLDAQRAIIVAVRSTRGGID